MTTLYVAPGSTTVPRMITFDDIQAELGIISFAYPFEDENVAIAFDDNGIANKRPPNRTINGEIIPGSFYVIGITGDGEVTGLAPDMVEKYTTFFSVPEFFPEGQWKITTKVEDRPYAAVIHVISEWVTEP